MSVFTDNDHVDLVCGGLVYVGLVNTLDNGGAGAVGVDFNLRPCTGDCALRGVPAWGNAGTFVLQESVRFVHPCSHDRFN
jgi:hypothetical protein